MAEQPKPRSLMQGNAPTAQQATADSKSWLQNYIRVRARASGGGLAPRDTTLANQLTNVRVPATLAEAEAMPGLGDKETTGMYYNRYPGLTDQVVVKPGMPYQKTRDVATHELTHQLQNRLGYNVRESHPAWVRTRNIISEALNKNKLRFPEHILDRVDNVQEVHSRIMEARQRIGDNPAKPLTQFEFIKRLKANADNTGIQDLRDMFDESTLYNLYRSTVAVPRSQLSATQAS